MNLFEIILVIFQKIWEKNGDSSETHRKLLDSMEYLWPTQLNEHEPEQNSRREKRQENLAYCSPWSLKESDMI